MDHAIGRVDHLVDQWVPGSTEGSQSQGGLGQRILLRATVVTLRPSLQSIPETAATTSLGPMGLGEVRPSPAAVTNEELIVCGGGSSASGEVLPQQPVLAVHVEAESGVPGAATATLAPADQVLCPSSDIAAASDVTLPPPAAIEDDDEVITSRDMSDIASPIPRGISEPAALTHRDMSEAAALTHRDVSEAAAQDPQLHDVASNPQYSQQGRAQTLQTTTTDDNKPPSPAEKKILGPARSIGVASLSDRKRPQELGVNPTAILVSPVGLDHEGPMITKESEAADQAGPVSSPVPTNLKVPVGSSGASHQGRGSGRRKSGNVRRKAVTPLLVDRLYIVDGTSLAGQDPVTALVANVTAAAPEVASPAEQCAPPPSRKGRATTTTKPLLSGAASVTDPAFFAGSGRGKGALGKRVREQDKDTTSLPVPAALPEPEQGRGRKKVKPSTSVQEPTASPGPGRGGGGKKVKPMVEPGPSESALFSQPHIQQCSRHNNAASPSLVAAMADVDPAANEEGPKSVNDEVEAAKEVGPVAKAGAKGKKDELGAAEEVSPVAKAGAKGRKDKLGAAKEVNPVTKAGAKGRKGKKETTAGRVGKTIVADPDVRKGHKRETAVEVKKGKRGGAGAGGDASSEAAQEVKTSKRGTTKASGIAPAATQEGGKGKIQAAAIVESFSPVVAAEADPSSLAPRPPPRVYLLSGFSSEERSAVRQGFQRLKATVLVGSEWEPGASAVIINKGLKRSDKVGKCVGLYVWGMLLSLINKKS